MTGLLDLKGISAGYNGNLVVKKINLSIPAGEFCALLGLNGSGKTTLLKAVCGLIPTEEGYCMVDGLDCTRFHEHRRARYISYIPQRHSAMEGISVLDAVLMGFNPHLKFLDSPNAEQKKTAWQTLRQMQLDDLGEKDFARLSEGQKQMVILTRTLVQNTPVMLMDEPDSALDFLNRHQMLRRVRNLIHSGKRAGLITLHDPNFALCYCDRLVLLKDGEIACDLVLKNATKQEIRNCLAHIYGDIFILEHDGRFMMMQT